MIPHRRPDLSAFRGVALFGGYGRRQLAPLVPHVDRLVVAPGASLARAGRRPRQVVVIVAGEAAVRRFGVEAGRLGPGEVVGAAEETDGTAHDADVVAETAVSALVIEGRSFRWALRSLPGLADRLAPHDRPAPARSVDQRAASAA
jgi:CRP-like cAMP-binding protein